MLDFLQTAEEAARLGGQVLRTWSTRFTVREKSRANLVTEADTASQQAIHEFLRKRFPGHAFLGEEGLLENGGQSAFRWIIDPLDGTTNYVHGFPFYAVSIGLEREGRLVAGAIYNPVTDEMFLAAAGSGACLNRQPLRCSVVDTLTESMLVASLPVATHPEDAAVKRFLKVLGRAQTVQRTGSAALNLAYLAAGRIDGFWSTSLHPWDMAAGVLLVREAGGLVTQLDGGTFRLETPDLLATNGTTVHDELSQLLAGNDGSQLSPGASAK
jgi:myo-inositol-1(or 4)-monophosphatase